MSRINQKEAVLSQDFPKAMKFYELTLEHFKQQIGKLQITFPQKYEYKQDFMRAFEELDDLERLLWCDHQLKEAYLEHSRREGGETARKNILWTLMVCKQFKIGLGRDYQLMKMIRELWLNGKIPNQQEEVREKLKEIFLALGETPTETRKDIRKSIQTLTPHEKKKNTTCGCGGDCLIF